MKIGVLALQGSVLEHSNIIESSGDEVVFVKTPSDLNNLDGLIIPGGESTAIIRLLKIKELDKEIIKKSKLGLRIWGTCAGLILLSSELKCQSFIPLKLIDITVSRNSYGSQLYSSTSEIDFNGSKSRVRFIRAPRIMEIGENIDVLSEFNGDIVAVKSGNIMVTSFHPEITGCYDFYNYFKTL